MIYFASIRLGDFQLSGYSTYSRPMYLIKIGHTRACVVARIDQLRMTTGRPVELLAWMEGGLQEEAELHKKFDHIRVAEMGHRAPEWFYPGKELLKLIEEISSVAA